MPEMRALDAPIPSYDAQIENPTPYTSVRLMASKTIRPFPLTHGTFFRLPPNGVELTPNLRLNGSYGFFVGVGS